MVKITRSVGGRDDRTEDKTVGFLGVIAVKDVRRESAMIENSGGGQRRRSAGSRGGGSRSRGGGRAGRRTKVCSGETSDKLGNGLRERGSSGDSTGSGGDGGGRNKSRSVFPSDKVQPGGRGGGKGNLKKIDLEKDGSGLHGHRFFEGRHQVGMVETT